MMRHADPTKPTRIGRLIPTLLLLIPLAGCATAAWTLPANLIPLPKQTRTCTVTGGGTLRLHTSDCGTLLIRGHTDTDKGEHVTVTSTGPIAWDVRQ